MDREADILQDRVQIPPFDGCRDKARERVGRQQDEQQENRGNPSLDGQHQGPQFRRQIAAEGRHQRAKKRQDQNPQQHGALMIAPYARNLVQHRLGRMRILPDIQNREIGVDISGGQGGK